jgi:hypothetical protein
VVAWVIVRIWGAKNARREIVARSVWLQMWLANASVTRTTPCSQMLAASHGTLALFIKYFETDHAPFEDFFPE